jgi:hypothetical protein
MHRFSPFLFATASRLLRAQAFAASAPLAALPLAGIEETATLLSLTTAAFLCDHNLSPRDDFRCACRMRSNAPFEAHHVFPDLRFETDTLMNLPQHVRETFLPLIDREEFIADSAGTVGFD